jgi:hypothetical protein
VQTLSPIVRHAGLWRGTPESFVDLHPSAAVQSSAGPTDGTYQGGYVEWVSLSRRAAIWNGTPESVVDLSGGRESIVTGMAPGTQVGWAQFSGGASHACVWRGTPESFTDFTPAGTTLPSEFHATTGRVHVGLGFIGPSPLARAAINFGTPESWVDLHQFLPAQYGSFSSATSVCQDGDTIFVAGWAEGQTGFHEAVLWVGTPPCYPNCDGATAPPLLGVPDFACFLQRFQSGDGYANCDRSTTPPVLNVADFTCFLRRFAAGCP